MSSLYILLLPLFSYVLYKRIKALQQSRKSSNPSKFKADFFFTIAITCRCINCACNRIYLVFPKNFYPSITLNLVNISSEYHFSWCVFLMTSLCNGSL